MMRFSRLILLFAGLVPAMAAAQTPVARPAAEVRDPVAARDSAIRQLEVFLQEYPDSPLRPRALLQLGELLVRRADERFAAAQRQAAGPPDAAPGSDAPIKPDYGAAIRAYEELTRRFPDFERIDVAEYTLGTLYTGEQRYAEAADMFRRVVANEQSRYRPEAYFRLGDALFELGAQATGDRRRTYFAEAAQAYEEAVEAAEPGGDIWFLALYKLGWSYYNQATRANQPEYRQAVEVFSRLVDAYDELTPEQQARLGLREEAIEYMAIAFTQFGGAEAATEFFARRGGAPYKMTILRRVAESLVEQGQFGRAVEAYRTVIAEAPTDTGALAAQRQIIDIFQNRAIEPDSAQAARLALIERFAPGGAWAQANPQRAEELRTAREEALRQAGQFALAAAQRANRRPQFAQAASLYEQYLQEFAQSDSAQAVNLYLAEALFGQGELARAGAQYLRAAYGYGAATGDSLAQVAGRNAIVAFDSAVAVGNQQALDSLFLAVDRYVEAFPQTDVARTALRQKARRASDAERWAEVAEAFRTYVQRYPNDPYAPTASKLIGDALYRQGQYAEAQVQWEQAQQVARQTGRRALADTIAALQTSAAAEFADTLVRRGEYARAAEEVYVAFADRNPQSPEAADALRDAIETYQLILSDSVAPRVDMSERTRARRRSIELIERLVSQYPNYQYRRQYELLRADLFVALEEREQAVTALRELLARDRQFEGRAGAVLSLAANLDTLGRDAEAAAAYADFATTYGRDPRAPDALYNAALTYLEAGDTTAAARTFGQFAQRFPRDERATAARGQQVELLRTAGRTEEVAQICQGRIDESVRGACAEEIGRQAFASAMQLWSEYDALELVIPSQEQLTQRGIQRASAPKRQLLERITSQLERAIRAGNPLYLSAATYMSALAQWEYGRYIENVELPPDLAPAAAEQARQAAASQAEQFYGAARSIWQELIQKAEAENIENVWVGRARTALQGDVPNEPPGDAFQVGARDAGAVPGGAL